MLRRNLDYAFIMEDDILFAKDWKKKLTAATEVEDPEWDLVLLNASEALEKEETWLPCRQQWLTGAYIVSKKGARWMLANFPEKWEADWMTWKLQDQGHSYAYFPWPVIQEGKDSIIGSDVEANRNKVLQLLGNRVSNYIN
jgi:GR25 family glycosyltransferase involved in LPS biosynthesis